jgi:hypothetical protein
MKVSEYIWLATAIFASIVTTSSETDPPTNRLSVQLLM